MNDSTFDAASTALAAARRDARAIESWPEERVPRDLAEAYRLQAAVTRELGAIGGWKVAAVTAAQRESLGVEIAIGAPLLQPWMHDVRRQGVELRITDFIAAKLECEFAFELRHDLAPRPQPRDPPQLTAAQEPDEEGGELERRLRRRTGLLQLGASGAAGKLQLPEACPVLDPVPQRHPVPREHEVAGVVVRRDEDPCRLRFAAELG